MKKRISKAVAYIAFVCISIFFINGFYYFFIDDEHFLYVYPNVKENMEILDRAKPKKLYAEKVDANHEPTSSNHLLTNDPVMMEKVISDLQSTWVTTLRGIPKHEPSYQLRFTDESGELIYPLDYYPESDVIVFYGRQNMVSISTCETLKNLLEKKRTALVD